MCIDVRKLIVPVKTNEKGGRVATHAFTNMADARRFAERQGFEKTVKYWDTTYIGDDPDHVWMWFGENALHVSSDQCLTHDRSALIDPYPERYARGEALWHVAVRGDVFTATLAFGGQHNCRASFMPVDDRPTVQWFTAPDEPRLHVFAKTQEEAEAAARKELQWRLAHPFVGEGEHLVWHGTGHVRIRTRNVIQHGPRAGGMEVVPLVSARVTVVDRYEDDPRLGSRRVYIEDAQPWFEGVDAFEIIVTTEHMVCGFYVKELMAGSEPGRVVYFQDRAPSDVNKYYLPRKREVLVQP